MLNLDILLVNPSNRKETYQNLSTSYAAYEPPVWAGMLASFLRIKGLSIDILDTNINLCGHADNAQIVHDMNPNLVAIVCYGHQPSASTLVMTGARALAQEIKNINPLQKIIFVGGHVAALPERTLKEEPCDFVCDGEGPYTLFQLGCALKERSPHFSKVQGLLYKDEDGNIIHTASASLVQDLDNEMPGVAWDLLPVEKYVAHNWHRFGHLDAKPSYASLYTSLGCPFSCDFCCIQAPFKTGENALNMQKNSYRMWSVDSVMKQLEYLVERYDIHNIKFSDELFVFNKEHVNELCSRITERGYDLNICAYVRVDTWTDEILDTLRNAGVRWLSPGIESGNDKVRKDIHKSFSQERAITSIKAFKSAGINTIGNFLVGLPEDDLQSMRETLDFAKELNCEFMNLFCAMAYPGSKLYLRALEENILLPKTWNGYSQHAYDSLPLPTRYIRGLDVLKFRDNAFTEYYTNPLYLAMIYEKFGIDTVNHVKNMAATPLPRAYKDI